MKRRRFNSQAAALLAVVTIAAGAVFTGCLQDTPTGGSEETGIEVETTGADTIAVSIAAGSYTGTAQGFGGDITAAVTIDEAGNILSITADASSETENIGGEAAGKLAADIVASQSLLVDTISGATITSEALLAAVEDALLQAGVDAAEWRAREVVKNGVDEELTVDVVVVGAGGAGTAAALAAAQEGASVLIVEKTSAVGGNTRLASGFFAVGTDLQAKEGLDLSVDIAVNTLLEFNNYLSNGPLTRAIVEKSADTISWLTEAGMEFYVQQQTTQFAHENDPYKYKTYHKYVDSGTGFENIFKELDALGATLKLNTSLSSIQQNEDGIITGITALKDDGGILTVHAKATIICTGGYGANEEKVAENMNGAYLNSLGMPNYGEGLILMEEAGAIDWDSTPLLHACQFAEAQVTQESSAENLAGFSDSSLTQLLMSPLLWVDQAGNRFVNEDVVYDTAFWANAAYTAGGKYYIIVDKATLEAYTQGTAMRISEAGPGASMEPDDFVALADLAVAAGTAFKGTDLAALAAAAGLDAERLETAISRYNTMIENQVDTDYNKSLSSLLYPVAEGEYYAFDCRAVFLGTIGGVKVNEKLEVIDIDYNPIPGLYTAGTNAGGYYEGKGYPPYEGLACGFAWTSGRIAGESAAEYINK